MEIRILARRGMGIRAIARELRISRNTVRRYLRGEAVREVGGCGPGRPRKLAPYEAWLRRRVESAAPARLPATVLHREVAAMGYDGTERAVRRFVAQLHPPVAIELVVRFETAPGEQAQMDWSEHRLGRTKVYAFVGVLGYSRWMYLEYVESMRSEELIACHRRMAVKTGMVDRPRGSNHWGGGSRPARMPWVVSRPCWHGRSASRRAQPVTRRAVAEVMAELVRFCRAESVGRKTAGHTAPLEPRDDAQIST